MKTQVLCIIRIANQYEWLKLLVYAISLGSRVTVSLYKEILDLVKIWS